MAYVNVPNDLSKIESKVISGLSKRQIICYFLGGLVGLPTYFLVATIFRELALLLAAVLAAPFFLAGFYKSRDGRPFEKVLFNYIDVRYRRPRVRYWQPDNLYNSVETFKKIEEVKLHAAQITADAERKKAHQTHRPLRRFAKSRKAKNP